MKSLLLSMSLLSLTLGISAQATDGMLTKKEAEYMRYNGVSINITEVDDRVVSRRATAYYEASLTNPYARAIRCNIDLTSSRGVNTDFEVIDTKSHIGVYASPQSVVHVHGAIEIKSGRGDDGLQWVGARGHLVLARNCIFVD
jgi:hypothetical protein